MAKTPSELSRKVLQNIRTNKGDAEIKSILANTLCAGEIAVQMGSGATTDESEIDSGLWILAEDGVTPVKFVSEKKVEEMIKSGAVEEVDEIEAAVGLESGGTLPESWGTGATYYTTGDTIISAVEKIDGAVNELSASTVVIENNLAALSGHVQSLDKTGATEAGQVVTYVEQADGLVSEHKEYLTDMTISGYVKTADHGALADSDTLEVALSKLENNIQASQCATTVSSSANTITVVLTTGGTVVDVNVKQGEHVIAFDGGEGIYTNIQLSGVTPSDTNVKEEYILKATDGTQLGESIKIYKDSAYKEIYLGTSADTINTTTGEITKEEGDKQSLNYAYMKADGTYDLVKVDVSTFLSENEFKSGVTATDHIVHGVVAGKSEAFLQVDGDGFYLSGVQAAIDAAMASGKTEILTAVTGDSAERMTITKTTAADGHDVYEFALNDVPSLSAITSAITVERERAQAAEGELAGLLGAGGNEGSRTYSHTGTNYLDSNASAKADAETLDSLLGKHDDAEAAYDVEFSTASTVADQIAEIKKAIDEAQSALTISAVDDDKYIATEVTTATTGTTIGVSAITAVVSASTSAATGLADAYDVKQFAVSDVKDNASNGAVTRIAIVTEDDVKKLDVSNLCVDCGTF